MKVIGRVIFLLSSLSTIQQVVGDGDEDSPVYGVDVSFPMHHAKVTTNYPWLPHNVDKTLETPTEYQDMPIQPLGDRQSFYDEMIQGCVDFYGKDGSRCLQNEKGRIAMSLRQPKGMYNYTKLGYTKIRAPDRVFQLIKEFWEQSRDKQSPEQWPTGNTYTNHWSSPTYMASVENEAIGGGIVLKQEIWHAARDTISEWTGQELAQCSLYGIRIYKEGSVLATHVDRLPLVSSAIINVDQDVDEPWPLEVIGHDGVAVNVTMEPGDLVLYESHSILHGRPFPLKGRFMANIFIHFEPIGPVGGNTTIDPDLPLYVIRGSEEEKNWRKRNPKGYEVAKSRIMSPGTTELHSAAALGRTKAIKDLLQHDSTLVHKKDSNGWTALHEAARAGEISSIELLLEHGADVNARTLVSAKNPTGGSVLFWAIEALGPNHETVELLKKHGAKYLKPGVMGDEL